MYKLSYMLYTIKVLIILREKKITASNFQIVQYFTLKYSFENTIKGNIVPGKSFLMTCRSEAGALSYSALLLYIKLWIKISLKLCWINLFILKKSMPPKEVPIPP